MDQSPLSMPFDLSRLSNAGAEIDISANEKQLADLARWIGVDGVIRLVAMIALERSSVNRFSYRAHLNVALLQSCVVTLEPVQSELSLEIERSLHLTTGSVHDLVVDDQVSASADDNAEEIASPLYDLAGPLLEELVLAIDPYPRAPGVEFEAGRSERDVAESPFGILKSLKNRN